LAQIILIWRHIWRHQKCP